MPELPPALAAALEAQRDALNARFALRQRAGTRIDPAAFLDHLRMRVSPIVTIVDAQRPERTPSVVSALYDVSLDLFAASLVGPDSRLPLVGRVWDELLPALATLVARQPQQVAACLCNAAVQVASQRGASADLWLARMKQTVNLCDSVERLLEVGLIAAWQAGLAQYRGAALAAAARLTPVSAAATLGLTESAAAQVGGILARMTANAWLTAEAAANSDPARPALELKATVGAFSGYGGLFLRPPSLSTHEGRLCCTDGVAQWQLLADAYGSWLRPLGEATKSVARAKGGGDFGIDRQGTVRWGKLSISLPHLAGASSLACDGATLAVTIPTSHHIFLLGRTGGTA